MEYLELYNKAKLALSEAYSVDELSAIIDQSEIIKHAAQIVKDDEMVQMATEIKLRAERRFGEVSRELEKAKGNQYKSASSIPLKKQVLSDVGVSEQMNHQFEKLAAIPEQEFEKALNTFKDEGKMSRKKLLDTANKQKRAKKITIPIMPEGVFNVIYADPPWKYSDSCEGGGIQSVGAIGHYPLMSIIELCEMKLPKIANNAVLFLWVTSPILEESFEVIKAWKFIYKASFVWDKIGHNMGHYNSVRHEFLLICTRGSYTPEEKKLYDSVQSIQKTKKHSEKPKEFREIIEKLYPNSNKIELFARIKHENWDAYGNEIL